MGRTACTEPQCLYSRAIPLLPLWAVRPVQNFRSCTRMLFTLTLPCVRGPGSVVVIATGYGLEGSGIESRWGAKFSAPVQTGPGAHPASCTKGTGTFQKVKSGWGVRLTPHPFLVPLVMIEQSYTPTPTMVCTTCTEHQCLYKGALYLYLTI
jgi:hypothetical protein